MVNNLYNKSNYSDDSFVLIPPLPKFDDNKWVEEYGNLSNEEKKIVNENCCQFVINYFKEIEKPYSSIFCFGLTTTIISIAFSGGAVATITCIAATIFAAGKLSNILKEKESFIKDIWECELCSINEAKLAFVTDLLNQNETLNKKAWNRLLLDYNTNNPNNGQNNDLYTKILAAKLLWDTGYRLPYSNTPVTNSPVIEMANDSEKEISFEYNNDEQDNPEESLVVSEEEQIEAEIVELQDEIEEIEYELSNDSNEGIEIGNDDDIFGLASLEELPNESEEEIEIPDSQEISGSEEIPDSMFQSALDLLD